MISCHFTAKMAFDWSITNNPCHLQLNLSWYPNRWQITYCPTHETRPPFQRRASTGFLLPLFCLGISSATAQMLYSCHTCASLQQFPFTINKQCSDDHPDVVGVSFTGDVIKRCHQLHLLVSECRSSYTVLCIIPDEKHLYSSKCAHYLVPGHHPLDGSNAVM